jgi:hypothetical protein
MLLTVSVVLATLAGPGVGGAAAAPSGVHFDPDSPAGQEYALPLERAREEASGNQGQSGSKGEGAALFGAGVSGGGPRGSAPAGAEGRRGGPGGESSSGGGAGQGKPGPAGSSPGPASAEINLAEAGGGFPLVAGVAMVVAILLAAAAVGMMVRRLPSDAAH